MDESGFLFLMIGDPFYKVGPLIRGSVVMAPVVRGPIVRGPIVRLTDTKGTLCQGYQLSEDPLLGDQLPIGT